MQLAQQYPRGAYSPFQHRRIANVNGVTPLDQKPCRVLHLLHSAIRQIHITPTGEQLFLIPLRFAVTNENQGPRLLRAFKLDRQLFQQRQIARSMKVRILQAALQPPYSRSRRRGRLSRRCRGTPQATQHVPCNMVWRPPPTSQHHGPHYERTLGCSRGHRATRRAL